MVSQFYVRDVADVYYAPEDAEHMVSYYTGKANKTGKKATGEQAVTIANCKKIWHQWRGSSTKYSRQS